MLLSLELYVQELEKLAYKPEQNFNFFISQNVILRFSELNHGHKVGHIINVNIWHNWNMSMQPHAGYGYMINI